MPQLTTFDRFAGRACWAGQASQRSQDVSPSFVWHSGQHGKRSHQKGSCQFLKCRAKLGTMFIAFTNTKGGVGKSTLACHLAIWLFDRAHSVAMLDTDPQGTSAEWIRRAEPKITVRSAADTDAIRTARAELLTAHEFVIADAPGEEGDASNAVTLLADLVILPLQPTKPDVRALKDALKTVRLAHAVTQGKRPDTLLVFNCVRKRSVRTSILRTQLGELGLRVASCEIRRLDALADSCDSSVMRENNPKAREAAADIDAFFAECLLEQLSQPRVANE